MLKEIAALVVVITIVITIFFIAVVYLEEPRGHASPTISPEGVGGEWHYLTPPEGSPPGTECRILVRGAVEYAVAGVYCWNG